MIITMLRNSIMKIRSARGSAVAWVTKRKTSNLVQLQETHLVASREVPAFCDAHSLLPYLFKAAILAAECFHTNQINAEIQQDQESGEECVRVGLVVNGSIEDILSAKDRYTTEWVASVPWPQRYMISLSFDIR
jgi:hypothetical protein